MFKFENKIYETWEELCDAVMKNYPELGDDSLVDFIEENVEELSELEILSELEVLVKEIDKYLPYGGSIGRWD